MFRGFFGSKSNNVFELEGFIHGISSAINHRFELSMVEDDFEIILRMVDHLSNR